MNKTIEDYLLKQSKILNIEFEKISNIYKDSDVKGGQNENVVAQFIKENYNANFTSIGAEIIDSFGSHTDEIDVCVSNSYQPFSSQYGQPLIAEGVDFVVQVKKTISTQEVDRIIKNCSRLKNLIRKPNDKDKVVNIGGQDDIKHLVSRIPYIVIAIESQLTLETLVEKLNAKYADKEHVFQPDALFVLSRGSIINFREGNGRTWITESGKKSIGFTIAHTKEHTLFEFMRYIHSFIPHVERQIHPLNNYFSTDLGYKIIGKVK